VSVSPPSHKEKYAYIEQSKFWLYAGSVLSFTALITGMYLFSVQHPGVWPYLIFVALTFVYLSASLAIGIFSRSFDMRRHIDTMVSYEPRQCTVDVFVPVCGEKIEIIENTLYHAKQISWNPAPTVYCLDDGGSDAVRMVCAKLNVSYVARQDRGRLKKAGNMRSAFVQTSGEFILVLDADFAARPEILFETIPHMDADEHTAIVQTPQFFRCEGGAIQYGSAYIQELFYRLIQVNRDYFQAAICVGTCALYRREALTPFGGTAAMPYSEDLHTGFMVTEAGHRVKYLPIALSAGLCPDTARAFFIQQYRWCTGSFSLFLNPSFWRADITWQQRFCYLSGMLYYIATGVSVVVAPLPPIIMCLFFPAAVLWYNYLFSVPSLLMGTVGLALWSRARWSVSSMQCRHISFWAHLFAMWDRLAGKTKEWVPTGNAAKTAHRFEAFRHIYYPWTIGTAGLAIGLSVWRGAQYGMVDFLPCIFLTSLHLYVWLSAPLRERD
jgi:cellulose synthase (UDP-forming)